MQVGIAATPVAWLTSFYHIPYLLESFKLPSVKTAAPEKAVPNTSNTLGKLQVCVYSK